MSYVIKIKNDSGTTKTWCGKEFTNQEEYTIPTDSNRSKWISDSTLITAIGNSEALVGDGSQYFSDVNNAVNWLKGEFPTDPDGATIIRPKAAKKGWTYHLCGVEFETSVLSSIVHNDVDGNALSVATIKLYDNTDTEITTQASADLNCVKTVITFEPTYDYEIIGGTIKTASNTIGDYRIWVVAVPDLTPAQGGSKVMVENLNLKFVDPNNGVQADGRASKLMTYNATYHTNKLQLTVKHPSGGKEKMLLALELFRQ